MPTYSIVIPAFEEAALIVQSLQTVHDFLQSQDWLSKTEVIVVAAKGNDNTADLAKSQAHLFTFFQVIEPGPKVGKGRDVKAGVLAAKGQFIIFTDADLATPIHHCKEAFAALEEGKADVAIGVRNLWVMHKSLSRKATSVFANWLVRLLLLPRIPDSQCGFKGFTRATAQDLFSRQTIAGWAFDMELLVIASRRRLKITKIPIKDWSDPKLEQGLVGESTWQASVNTFKELLRIRKQRRKGVYS
jgi:dolichyl-phosphate beta-glucosyltransferase